MMQDIESICTMCNRILILSNIVSKENNEIMSILKELIDSVAKLIASIFTENYSDKLVSIYSLDNTLPPLQCNLKEMINRYGYNKTKEYLTQLLLISDTQERLNFIRSIS